jgi:hypothetical protein
MDAYRAYGGDQYIQGASAVWSIMQSLQVTEADVVSGNHNHVKFVPQCNGRKCPLSFKLNIIYNDRSLTHVLGSVAGAIPSTYDVC